MSDRRWEHKLSPRETDELLERRIRQLTPRRLPDRGRGERPFVVLVDGQPGAGKSTLMHAIHRVLPAERVAGYDVEDDYKAHPSYDRIMREHGLYGQSVLEAAVPDDVQAACWAHLREADVRYDVIGAVPVHDEDWARHHVGEFGRLGYRVALVHLAANESGSTLALADRYQRDLDATGIGRWVEPGRHDDAYRRIPHTAHLLESGSFLDDIYVVTRDGYVVYENHRGPDRIMWRAPGARDAIGTEREWPPTQQQRDQFLLTSGALLDRDDSAAPPLEPAVARLVRTANSREYRRPHPRPDPREFTAEDWIGWRLRVDLKLVGEGDRPPGDGADKEQVDERQYVGGGSAPLKPLANDFGFGDAPASLFGRPRILGKGRGGKRPKSGGGGAKRGK